MSAMQKHFLALAGIFTAGALTAWALISGCSNEAVSVDPPPEAKPPTLQFKEWETPAAALVLSGEQHGYIEPCGCSETQSGGLARRADLIQKLGSRDWPVAGLDLGGSLKRDRLQSQLKFNTILRAMETMRYSAMALGFEELKLEAGRLLNNYQSQLNPQGETVHPVLAGANVVLYETPELGPVRSQTLSVGDVKIGVAAIVGESIKKKLFGDNEIGDITIKPPAEVLPGLLEELAEEQTDFNVLIAHASFEETEELLKQFPDFAVALCQTGGEEGREEAKTVGNTQVIQVGWKGKYVGVLAYYPDKEENRFRYELVELDNQNFENHESIEPHLIQYQQDIEANLAEVFQDLKGVSGSGETYVGAATCGECHTKAYAKWKSSKHAHAYDTLKTGREGQYSQPIARIYDPECLACHVTGWHPQEVTRYETGFLPEELAGERNAPELFHALQGQQCENCHGPGSGHVEQERLYLKEKSQADREKLTAARQQMQLTKAHAENHLCTKCHDYENSPDFEFDTYWDKIKHPWRD